MVQEASLHILLVIVPRVPDAEPSFAHNAMQREKIGMQWRSASIVGTTEAITAPDLRYSGNTILKHIHNTFKCGRKRL